MPEQIIQGETWIATIPERWIMDYAGDESLTRYVHKTLAKAPMLGEIITRQEARKQNSFQQELERTNTKIEFSKYSDGSLRLYPPGSIVGDTPAAYSQEDVVVKIRVYVGKLEDGYIVVLPTTRTELDKPDTVEKLAIAAYNWRDREVGKERRQDWQRKKDKEGDIKGTTNRM